MSSENFVGKTQRRGAAARTVVGQHGDAPDVELELRFGACSVDKHGLTEVDGGSDGVIGVQGVVLNAGGAGDDRRAHQAGLISVKHQGFAGRDGGVTCWVTDLRADGDVAVSPVAQVGTLRWSERPDATSDGGGFALCVGRGGAVGECDGDGLTVWRTHGGAADAQLRSFGQVDLVVASLNTVDGDDRGQGVDQHGAALCGRGDCIAVDGAVELHLNAVTEAADELAGPTGVVRQAPAVGAGVAGVHGGQTAGDLNGGTGRGDQADFADLHRADSAPCVARDHASECERADFRGVQAVAGVYACAAEGDRGRRIGGVKRPIGGRCIGRREFSIGRNEGTCIHQQMVIFTQGEVGHRVDGDGTRGVVDADQAAVGGDDGVGGGVVVVDQGEVFTGNSLDVLVEAEHQVGAAGNGASGLAGDAQGRGVEAQGKDGAGSVVAQMNRIFYKRLQADAGCAGAQAGGGEAPGARAIGVDVSCPQPSAIEGVIHGDALACGKGAGVAAAQGRGGIVAGAAGIQCALGVAKVVGHAGDAGVRLRHIGHGFECSQGVDGAAVVDGGDQGPDDSRQVAVGHAGHAQQLKLGFGDSGGTAGCRVQGGGLHDGMHGIGVQLKPGKGVDSAAGYDVQRIAQQSDFARGLDVVHTDGCVLHPSGDRRVVVRAVGAAQYGGIGVDQKLNFSRCVDAAADNAGTGQSAVDAVQVAASARADTGDASVQVGLQAGGRSGVEVGVSTDEGQAVGDGVDCGLQLNQAVGCAAIVRFGSDGANDRVQVVGCDALHTEVQEVVDCDAGAGGLVVDDRLHQVHDAGQFVDLSHGVDVAGQFAGDGAVEQGEIFYIGAGRANARTDGRIVCSQRVAGGSGVRRGAIGFSQDRVVGVHQCLHFGAGVHAGVHNVGAGQGAVDGEQVAVGATCDTRHTHVKVSLCAGRGATVGQCVGSDQCQGTTGCTEGAADSCLQISQGTDI